MKVVPIQIYIHKNAIWLATNIQNHFQNKVIDDRGLWFVTFALISANSANFCQLFISAKINVAGNKNF